MRPTPRAPSQPHIFRFFPIYAAKRAPAVSPLGKRHLWHGLCSLILRGRALHTRRAVRSREKQTKRRTRGAKCQWGGAPAIRGAANWGTCSRRDRRGARTAQTMLAADTGDTDLPARRHERCHVHPAQHASDAARHHRPAAHHPAEMLSETRRGILHATDDEARAAGRLVTTRPGLGPQVSERKARCLSSL